MGLSRSALDPSFSPLGRGVRPRGDFLAHPPLSPPTAETPPMSFPKRYLVRFGPKNTTHLFTDLLVIGGGIAGFRAALAAPPGMKVLVVTKDKVQVSNSSWAQGGLAAV